jgi:hypothetical protein
MGYLYEACDQISDSWQCEHIGIGYTVRNWSGNGKLIYRIRLLFFSHTKLVTTQLCLLIIYLRYSTWPIRISGKQFWTWFTKFHLKECSIFWTFFPVYISFVLLFKIAIHLFSKKLLKTLNKWGTCASMERKF